MPFFQTVRPHLIVIRMDLVTLWNQMIVIQILQNDSYFALMANSLKSKRLLTKIVTLEFVRAISLMRLDAELLNNSHLLMSAIIMSAISSVKFIIMNIF